MLPQYRWEISDQFAKEVAVLHQTDKKISSVTRLDFGDSYFTDKDDKRCKKRFPGEMEQVVPWQSRIRPIRLFCPEAGNGR